MERNPYASPVTSPIAGGARRVPIASVPAEPEHGLVNVVEQAAQPPRAWRIAFGRDEAWLFVPDEESAFAFTHAEMAEHANIMLWGNFVILGLRGLLPDGRAIAFKVEGDAKGALRRWLRSNQRVHVERALKRRLRFSLPLGIFMTLMALPILRPNVEPFTLVFGLGIAALAIVAPRAPRPVLLAVDGVLWLALGAGNVVNAVHGSTASGFFALVCLLLARGAFRDFAFYR